MNDKGKIVYDWRSAANRAYRAMVERRKLGTPYGDSGVALLGVALFGKVGIAATILKGVLRGDKEDRRPALAQALGDAAYYHHLLCRAYDLELPPYERGGRTRNYPTVDRVEERAMLAAAGEVVSATMVPLDVARDPGGPARASVATHLRAFRDALEVVGQLAGANLEQAASNRALKQCRRWEVEPTTGEVR